MADLGDTSLCRGGGFNDYICKLGLPPTARTSPLAPPNATPVPQNAIVGEGLDQRPRGPHTNKDGSGRFSSHWSIVGITSVFWCRVECFGGDSGGPITHGVGVELGLTLASTLGPPKASSGQGALIPPSQKGSHACP